MDKKAWERRGRIDGQKGRTPVEKQNEEQFKAYCDGYWQEADKKLLEELKNGNM